jgi:hypothetical protein
MLSKLLKYDLRKNMRWLWILFVGTIVVAALTRGLKELGQNMMFFKVLGIFFDSVFYSLLVNVILQPFLRNFLNFSKSLYNDESYLTHTLPVTKNQIINSKCLTALIEIVLGFITLVVSLFIMFASPTFFDTLKLLLSTIVSGEFSVVLLLILFVILVMIEFLMFISIIYFSIILAYKSKEKRVLRTFLITAAMSFASSTVLGIVLIVVLAINGVNLSSSVVTLPSSAVLSVVVTGIVVYFAISVLFYFLAKREFSRGVNVD